MARTRNGFDAVMEFDSPREEKKAFYWVSTKMIRAILTVFFASPPQSYAALVSVRLARATVHKAHTNGRVFDIRRVLARHEGGRSSI